MLLFFSSLLNIKQTHLRKGNFSRPPLKCLSKNNVYLWKINSNHLVMMNSSFFISLEWDDFPPIFSSHYKYFLGTMFSSQGLVTTQGWTPFFYCNTQDVVVHRPGVVFFIKYFLTFFVKLKKSVLSSSSCLKWWCFLTRDKKKVQNTIQCENFRIILSLRFYVKSILHNLESPKTYVFAIVGALEFVNLVNISLQKCKNSKSRALKMADFKAIDLAILISRKIWGIE